MNMSLCASQSHLIYPPHQHCCQPRTNTLSQHTHIQHKQQCMHHSHSNYHIHMGYNNNLTGRPKTTTDTTQGHRPSSKSVRNLIILQVNINGLKNKLEEIKLLIHDTHAYIITIHETKLTPKANTHKVHNLTTLHADRLHKAGGGLITLIRDNITFTTTDILLTINTHNTEFQMVKVHITNTEHITIANMYIPPRDSTSTHYKTAGTDIQHCIQYITNIPHSVLTRDVNTHSTLWLWYSYTDDHRGQLIADVISNSDHITQKHQPECQTLHYNKHHHQISLQCLTHCTTGHRGQLNMHYHQTTCPSSPQLTYKMTPDYNKTD